MLFKILFFNVLRWTEGMEAVLNFLHHSPTQNSIIWQQPLWTHTHTHAHFFTIYLLFIMYNDETHFIIIHIRVILTFITAQGKYNVKQIILLVKEHALLFIRYDLV